MQLCSFENLLLAYDKAARGKRGGASVARFEYALADRLLELRCELRELRWRPGGYHSFHIHEPKRRLISAAPFRDRIVHHALCNIIEPRFEADFSVNSFANRKGMGTHRALDRVQALARRYRYAMRLDVVRHFPSIDHALLLRALGRRIHEPEILWLVERVIASGIGLFDGEGDPVFFEGDDLLAACRPRGLPIGNLTSQFWSNCYLHPFDQFVERELGVRGYARYVDDLVLFADTKSVLWTWKSAAIDRLARLRLCVHETQAQVFPVGVGIPWLGFIVYPGYRRLKARKMRHATRSLRAAYARCRSGDEAWPRLSARVRAWTSHAACASCRGARKAVLARIVN